MMHFKKETYTPKKKKKNKKKKRFKQRVTILLFIASTLITREAREVIYIDDAHSNTKG